MHLKSLLKTTSFALLTLCATLAAKAQVIFDEATFLSLLQPGYYTEDFSTPSAGDIYSNGVFAYQLSAANDVWYGGTPMVASTWTTIDSLFANSLSGNIYAVGGYVYLNDTDGLFLPGTISIYLNDPARLDPYLFTPNSVEASFIGFISATPITSIELSGPGSVGEVNAFAGVGNLTVGGITAVPEPSTYGLMGAGALAGLGFLRRRKSNKA